MLNLTYNYFFPFASSRYIHEPWNAPSDRIVTQPNNYLKPSTAHLNKQISSIDKKKHRNIPRIDDNIRNIHRFMKTILWLSMKVSLLIVQCHVTLTTKPH